MKNSIILTAIILVAVPVWAWAAMGSASFQISTSVLSGGGGEMFSPSFSVHSVLGQPSPVAMQQNHPVSPGFILYAGYMYTLPAGCFGDFDVDGDVDGWDLFFFQDHYPESFNWQEFEQMAHEFGRLGCE